MDYADPMQRLVEALKRLPGIGAKSAQRLAFAILHQPREEALALSAAVQEVKDRIRLCSLCCHITDVDPCRFCSDETRDRSLVCVVEEPDAPLLALWDRLLRWGHPVTRFSLRGLRDALNSNGLRLERSVEIPGALGVYRAGCR